MEVRWLNVFGKYCIIKAVRISCVYNTDIYFLCFPTELLVFGVGKERASKEGRTNKALDFRILWCAAVPTLKRNPKELLNAKRIFLFPSLTHTHTESKTSVSQPKILDLQNTGNIHGYGLSIGEHTQHSLITVI